MTLLRQRMVEDMQLRGLSEKTKDAYLRGVRQLVVHYSRSPDQISEEELRQYFLYHQNTKRTLSSAADLARAAVLAMLTVSRRPHLSQVITKQLAYERC